MSDRPTPPAWRLPEGVNAALWHYAHAPRLADEEDDYFAGHPLFEADARALDARFTAPAPLVDLGCGTGRHALRFARRGFPVAAVDLSHAMLRKVRDKAQRDGLPMLCIEANLCRLGAFPDGMFSYALSMFSTLGMIRGRAARRVALAEACRLLRPGGRLALHAHNLWLNLRDPQGRAWLAQRLPQIVLDREDAGDRRMTYRGIPNMEVHLYRWRELKRELRDTGFLIDEVLPIDEVHAAPIAAPWLAQSWRAGGWLVFAHRPAASNRANQI
ncbi:MAG: class I SAM-dependent methyltransferase [Isosphaeraceae bacterium]|nr:class I SAM-dependent methyltransferase [Isosphaeraceae bacterium]